MARRGASKKNAVDEEAAYWKEMDRADISEAEAGYEAELAGEFADLDKDFELDLIDIFLGDNTRIDGKIEGISLKHSVKAEKTKLLRIKNKQVLTDFLQALPQHGEVIHVVSSGDFDFFTFIPVTIDLLGGKVEECWITTWGCSNDNVNSLGDLLEKKRIGKLFIITGDSLKRRRPDIYANLVTKCREHGQNYRICRNHTKVIMFKQGEHYIVIEGSANLTGNPRLEQTVLFNQQDLYDFHKSWMEPVFRKEGDVGAKASYGRYNDREFSEFLGVEE